MYRYDVYQRENWQEHNTDADHFLIGRSKYVIKLIFEKWVFSKTHYDKKCFFLKMGILEKSFRPYFSTNPTFKNPLKNTTSYLVEASF